MLEIPETCLYAARNYMLSVSRFTMTDIVLSVQTPYVRRRTSHQRYDLRKQIAAALIRELMDDGRVVRMEGTGETEYFRHVLAEPTAKSAVNARSYAGSSWSGRQRRKY